MCLLRAFLWTYIRPHLCCRTHLALKVSAGIYAASRPTRLARRKLGRALLAGKADDIAVLAMHAPDRQICSP